MSGKGPMRYFPFMDEIPHDVMIGNSMNFERQKVMINLLQVLIEMDRNSTWHLCTFKSEVEICKVTETDDIDA